MAIGGGAGFEFDLVVVGGGSAAFAAAIRARQEGRRVVLVEQDVLGGTCVNVGCVPSKALLRSAEVGYTAGHHPFAGLTTSSGVVNLSAMVGQKDELVGRLRRSRYEDLVAEYGFDVVRGHGRFAGPEVVEVDGTPLRAGRFLVATGSIPTAPPVPGLDEVGYLTSTDALELTAPPRRLIVIGASAVGLELGQLYLHLGSRVTFVEMAQRIAPLEEPEVSEQLARVLADEGADIHTGTTVLGVGRTKSGAEVLAQSAGRRFRVEADRILVATGRRPNTADLGLDTAGVETGDLGAVRVDDELRTTNSRIFAAGDVTGGPQFVYVAGYEGSLAAENALLGAGHRMDLAGLPRVTFTNPPIASAGLTEAEARRSGHEVEVSVIGLDVVPRALVNRDTRGVVKLVAERSSDRLLGASIVGEGAGDAIQTAVLAIRHGLSVTELASTFHPYLTMVEGIKLASQAFTRDVAALSCCAT